jgi:signal transduction histidine kinase
MQKMLEIALNSAQRMLQLVNAILDISAWKAAKCLWSGCALRYRR